MKRCLKLFMFVLAFCCAFAAQTEPREVRELRMADQAILSSLVLSHSTEGPRLCKENKLACIGPAKEEIAIALIGARHTRPSRESLVQLLAYNLDGSVGEDYNCYVLNSAPLIKEQLAAANLDELANSCHQSVDRIVSDLKRAIPTFESTGVCSSPLQIKAKIAQLSKGIDKREKCSSEDF